MQCLCSYALNIASAYRKLTFILVQGHVLQVLRQGCVQGSSSECTSWPSHRAQIKSTSTTIKVEQL